MVEDESPSTGLSGALAYLEFVDGTSELETADAMGHVVFTGTGIASGVVSVTAALDATRTITSTVKPDFSSMKQVRVPLAQGTPTFNLVGTVKPVTVGDALSMQTSQRGLFIADHMSALTPYKMAVQPGQLFTVYGVEGNYPGASLFAREYTFDVVQFFHFDHPSLTADNTTYDIDITALPADPTATATGEIIIPGGDSGPLGGASSAWVTVQTSGANIGQATAMSVTADKSSFAYTVEYVAYAGVTPYTLGQILQADGSLSLRNVAGFPKNMQVLDNLELPLPITDTLSAGSVLDATATSADDVHLYVVQSGGAGVVWTVTVPAGKTSALPHLPDAIRGIIPAPPLQARLVTTSYLAPGIASTSTRTRAVPIVP